MRRREAETLPGLLGELAESLALPRPCCSSRRRVSFGGARDRAARVAGGLAAPGIGAGTASRCGCPTGPSGWSCTSRSPASARSRSRSTPASARTRCATSSSAPGARALAFAPGFKGIDFEGILEHAGARTR